MAHAGVPNLPPTCSDALHLHSHCSTPKILILIQGPVTQAAFLGSLFTQGYHGYATSPELVQNQLCHLLAHVLQGDQHPHSPQLSSAFLTCPWGCVGLTCSHLLPSPCPLHPSLPSPSLPSRSLAGTAHALCQSPIAEPAIALLIFCFPSPSGFQAWFKLLFEPFPELLSVCPQFFRLVPAPVSPSTGAFCWGLPGSFLLLFLAVLVMLEANFRVTLREQ